MIRAVYQVPDPDGPADYQAAHADIINALNALGYDFALRRGGYMVDIPDAGTTYFAPAARMLFCGSGLYRVEPVRARMLKPGDGILGFASGRDRDIWDAVMVLKYRPQDCGGTVRLVPDPDRCHPKPYVFGVVYGAPSLPVWKLAA